MSVTSKLKSAVMATEMTMSVALNTGVMPWSHKSLILIEPTSVCNLACPLCPTGTKTLQRTNKFIPMDIFNRIMEVTRPHAKGYILNMFGEPTFHPDFKEMLEVTRPLPVWLSTNLSYETDKVRLLAEYDHLNVICSVDTVNADEYTDYRVGGDYDRLMRNLDVLLVGKCNVYPQFLVPEAAYKEEEFQNFAAEHRVPLENMIIKAKLEYYRLDPTDKPVPGTCHSCYTGIYFDCDGYLVPCCNNVREELRILHIDQISSAEDIFRGKKVQRIRRALAEDKNTFKSCGRCPGISFWENDFVEHIKAVKATLFPWTHKQQMLKMQF